MVAPRHRRIENARSAAGRGSGTDDATTEKDASPNTLSSRPVIERMPGNAVPAGVPDGSMTVKISKDPVDPFASSTAGPLRNGNGSTMRLPPSDTKAEPRFMSVDVRLNRFAEYAIVDPGLAD